MKRLEKLVAGAVAGLLAMGAPTCAQAVSLVYRGAVADDEGRPLAQGATNIVFRLYANAAGPTDDALAVFDETVTLDGNGAFLLRLDLDEYKSLIASNRLNYVGLTVEGQEEIAPRQAILPQPYANRTETAARIGAGGRIAHVETGDVSCRSLVGNVAAQVTVGERLNVERRDDGASLRLDLSARALDIRATGGMTVFAGEWRPLDETWWSADWSSLKRGKAPTNDVLTVAHRGAYFISSLGECAGEDEAAAQYAQLQNLRNTLWRMPGVTFFGRKGDRIDGAFGAIFRPVCVEAGRSADSLVPPQVKAACLPYAGQLTGEEAAE